MVIPCLKSKGRTIGKIPLPIRCRRQEIPLPADMPKSYLYL